MACDSVLLSNDATTSHLEAVLVSLMAELAFYFGFVSFVAELAF